jgi:hypothetical protein
VEDMQVCAPDRAGCNANYGVAGAANFWDRDQTYGDRKGLSFLLDCVHGSTPRMRVLHVGRGMQ